MDSIKIYIRKLDVHLETICISYNKELSIIFQT